jgi:hypothetical protein
MLLSVILYGCSAPDLPPSAARDMIIKIIDENNFAKDKVLSTSDSPFFGEFHKTGSTYYGVIWDKGSDSGNIKSLYRCAQQGLLSISKIEEENGRSFYKIKPTDKGKSFIRFDFLYNGLSCWGTIKLADIISIEVTSVSEPTKVMKQKRRSVEFTYKYKPTPFGEIYLSSEQLQSVHKKTAIFTLSKGMWKISPEGMSDW